MLRLPLPLRIEEATRSAAHCVLRRTPQRQTPQCRTPQRRNAGAPTGQHAQARSGLAGSS
jgi:hypothetical protein